MEPPPPKDKDIDNGTEWDPGSTTGSDSSDSETVIFLPHTRSSSLPAPATTTPQMDYPTRGGPILAAAPSAVARSWAEDVEAEEKGQTLPVAPDSEQSSSGGSESTPTAAAAPVEPEPDLPGFDPDAGYAQIMAYLEQSVAADIQEMKDRAAAAGVEQPTKDIVTLALAHGISGSIHQPPVEPQPEPELVEAAAEVRTPFRTEPKPRIWNELVASLGQSPFVFTPSPVDQLLAGQASTSEVGAPPAAGGEETLSPPPSEKEEKEAAVEEPDAPEPEQGLARFSIWKTPPPDVIQGAMECSVCGQVRPPPFYQCEDGHLICAKDAEQLEGFLNKPKTKTKPTPTSTAAPLVFPKCPVHLGGGRVCDLKVIRGSLKLYAKLYAACKLNCPRMELGCEVKVPGSKLKKHLREECFHNVLIKCHNSYCGETVLRCEYLLHLRDEHGIPSFQGPSHFIKFSQERLRRRGEMVKTVTGGFGWVAATLAFDCQHFLVRVHEEMETLHFWVQLLKKAPAAVKMGEQEPGEDQRLCKLLGVASAPEQPATEVAGVDYWSQFMVRNERTGWAQKWTGRVGWGGWGRVSESGEYFQLYKTCLETKYKGSSEGQRRGYTWDMKLELKTHARANQ